MAFFDKTLNTIDASVMIGGSRVIKAFVRRIERRAVNSQRHFFYVMAHTMLGSASGKAPVLPGMAKLTFKPLADDYAKWRKKEPNKYKHFLRTGRLQRDLAAMNPMSKFGKPVVYLRQEGSDRDLMVVSSGSSEEGIKSYLLTKSGQKSRSSSFTPLGRIATLSVDMFPAIKGNLDSRAILNRLPKVTAFKLAGYKGQMDRDFLGPYAHWWINVRERNSILKDSLVKGR